MVKDINYHVNGVPNPKQNLSFYKGFAMETNVNNSNSHNIPLKVNQ